MSDEEYDEYVSEQDSEYEENRSIDAYEYEEEQFVEWLENILPDIIENELADYDKKTRDLMIQEKIKKLRKAYFASQNY